jgi:RsiW-degrading membrane proteinase PrsW (M82 family)
MFRDAGPPSSRSESCASGYALIVRVGLRISAVAVAFIVLWLYVGGVLLGELRNVALLPVWVVLGSTAVSTLILMVVLAAADSADPRARRSHLLLAAGVGGILSIVLGGTIDALIQPTAGAGAVDDRALLLSGFVEEACKLAVVYFFVRRRARPTMVDGLLLGAAVGLGFAAFESMGYAVSPFLDHAFAWSTMAQSGQIQVSRALFEPFGHPLWSALLGAAVVSSSNGRIPHAARVALAYLGVAIAHGAWDGAAVLGERVLGTAGLAVANAGVWMITAVELIVLANIVRKQRKSVVAAGTDST